MLDIVAEYAHLNAEGFRKILKKFDRHVGFAVSGAMQRALLHHSFCVDPHAPAGRCARARTQLERLLSAAGERPAAAAAAAAAADGRPWPASS